MKRLLAAFAAAIVSAAACAGPLQFVKDINRTLNVGTEKPVAFGTKSLMTLCRHSYTGANGEDCHPWITDGTPDGTHTLVRFVDKDWWRVGGYTVVGSIAYFITVDQPVLNDYRVNLWRTDGTPAGTTMITTVSGTAYYTDVRMVATSTQLFFLGPGDTLWRSDGTAAGTRQLTSTLTNPQSLAVLGDEVVFSAQDPNYGYEPFVSDGTVAGTVMLGDLYPAGYSSGPSSVTSSYGSVFFWASAEYLDSGVYATDGTPGGTQRLVPGSYRDHSNFVSFNGRTYFVTGAYPLTSTLWSSDGTPAGTTTVSLPVQPQNLAVAGSHLYFNAQDSSVWRMDSTGAVEQVMGAPSQYLCCSPMVAIGSDLYFSQQPAYIYQGYVLHDADGSVSPLAANQPLPWGVLAGLPLFWVEAGTDDQAGFWQPDGSFLPLQGAAGEPTNPSGAGSFVSMGDFAVFVASDGIHGSELWRSDGTEAGTTMVKDIAPGPAGAFNGPQMVKFGAYVYFQASSTGTGYSVFRTDGTQAGTVEVIPPSSNPQIALSGNALLISAGTDVWRIDSGSTTPLRILDAASFGASFVYGAVTAGGNTYACVLMSGTWHLVKLGSYPTSFTDLQSLGASAVDLVAVGNVVTYWGPFYSQTITPALWRSDGTAAGTYKLLDPQGPWALPALAAGAGRGVFVLGGTVYSTDGTLAGTRALLALASVDQAVSNNGDIWIAGVANGTHSIYRMRAGQAAFSKVADTSGTVLDFFFSGSIAFFYQRVASGSNELWMSGGDAATTQLVDAVGPDGYVDITSWYRPGIGAAIGRGAIMDVGASAAASEPYYLAFDSDPDAISFADAVGVKGNRFVNSAPAAITGIDVPLNVTASNGLFCVSSTNDCACDVQPFASSGIVELGESICVRQRTASTPSTSNTTLLQVGNILASFTTTTGTGPGLPNALVDFNGDGFGDLVVQHADGKVEVRLMQGTTVVSSAQFTPSAPGNVATTTGDFNGDGKTDLLYLRNDGAVEMWLMDGVSAPQVSTIMPAGTGWTVAHVGDFNADGYSDLLWRHTSAATSAWLMSGATILQKASLLPTGSPWTATHMGDFNGDGVTDILWRNGDGSVSMWLMNGLAASDRGSLLPSGSPWSPLGVADFDGDGRSDILWQATDGSVSMWMMNGRTVSSRVPLMGANTNWSVTHTPDFNGDGKADLVWLSRDGTIGTWLMNGGAVLEKRTQFGAGSGWTCAVAQDMSGDAKADIVWTHTSGAVGEWLLDGNSIVARAPLEAAGSTNKVVPLQFHH